MDYKKSKAPTNTVTRNIMEFCDATGNIYESVAIMGKRANQISQDIKQELNKKLSEFANYNDSTSSRSSTRNSLNLQTTTTRSRRYSKTASR